MHLGLCLCLPTGGQNVRLLACLLQEHILLAVFACRMQTLHVPVASYVSHIGCLTACSHVLSSLLAMHSSICRWWHGVTKASSSSPIAPEQNPWAIAPQWAPRQALQRRMLVTLLVLVFYFYPSVLTTTLSLFTCYRLDRETDAVQYYENTNPGVMLCAFTPASLCLTFHSVLP